MSATRPQASAPRRVNRQIRAPAACILAAILSANHAAALPAPSLPYLTVTSGQGLRFAAARPPAALRPPPADPATAHPSKDPTDSSTAPPAETTSATTTSPSSSALPDASPGAASSSSSPASDSSGSSATGDNPSAAPSLAPDPSAPVELLPDSFAPPPTVTINEFLPFFSPPVAPASRATYQQK